MDRAIPEVSKLIAKRQLLLAKQKEKERLRSVQKLVDNGLPISYSYPINKRNKEQQIEGKLDRLCFIHKNDALRLKSKTSNCLSGWRRYSILTRSLPPSLEERRRSGIQVGEGASKLAWIDMCGSREETRSRMKMKTCSRGCRSRNRISMSTRGKLSVRFQSIE